MNCIDRKKHLKNLLIQKKQSEENLRLAKEYYYNRVCSMSYIERRLKEIINGEFSNIKNTYYAGGTLCIDLDNDILIFLNLDETVNVQMGDKSWRRLLSIPAVKYIFKIYEDTKGITDYYKEKLFDSCYRSLSEELNLA